MNIELFLASDQESRLINFSIMMSNQRTIEKKLLKLFTLLLPPEPAQNDNTSNNFYYYKVAFLAVLGVNNLRELQRHHLVGLKFQFMEFINFFYIKTLLFKSYNKISRTHEAIIKKILTIITNIIQDDEYTKEKYEVEYRYLEENKLIPNFFIIMLFHLYYQLL